MGTRLSFATALCLLVAGCATPLTHDQIQTQFGAGLRAFDAGDYKTAYQTWRAIDDVDLSALRNVALMLRKGQGVDKDLDAAREKMQQAADAGLVTAQADLADMLIKGEGGAPDAKAALPWLVLAAHAGHPVAAFRLGQFYEEGTVVEKNVEKARQLYHLAAEGGLVDAQRHLATLPPPPQSGH